MPLSEPVYRVRVRHPITFRPIAELDSYLSLRYTRRWGAWGDFELKVGEERFDIDRVIQRNAIVEVLCNGVPEFTGWVGYRHMAVGPGDEGDEVWTLKGWDAPGDVVKRLTLPAPLTTNDASTTAGGDYDTVTGVTVAQAMRTYVDHNLISAYETARRVSYLRLGRAARPSLAGADLDALLPQEEISVSDAGEWRTTTWKARFRDLPDLLAQLARAGDASWAWRLDADAGLVYFDVIQGADRTEGTTSGYQQAVFSVSRDTLASLDYEDDGMGDLVNAVYAAAGGTSTTRVMLISKVSNTITSDWVNPDPMGDPFVLPTSLRTWGRREGLLDVREGASAAEVQGLADQYLTDHANLQRLTFQPLETNLAYRSGWDLGDTVTASFTRRNGTAIKGSAVITEVSREITPDGPQPLTVTVGQRKRSLVRSMREIDNGTLTARAI